MARLWVVDEIHHANDENNGYCTCGADLTKCGVYEATTPMRNALYKCEIHQVERLQKDLSHGLPPEHPDVRKIRKAYRKIGLKPPSRDARLNPLRIPRAVRALIADVDGG